MADAEFRDESTFIPSFTELVTRFTPTFRDMIAYYDGVKQIWIDDDGHIKIQMASEDIVDIGYASDYVYASEHGFEGTEQDWIEQMLIYATKRGLPNGIATLDSNGLVPSSQLPSYVDDVLEGYVNPAQAPSYTQFYRTRTGEAGSYVYSDAYTPESDKIYVDKESSKIYRWSGTYYIEISRATDILDDTKGAGDTDFTWTANKLATNIVSANPIFTNSISMGRKADTTVGENSTALGYNVTASGPQAHAEGAGTTASGYQSHAEGAGTTASGYQSHAEGGGSIASDVQSHAEGGGTTASGLQSHAEGSATVASGTQSHAEGYSTTASASQSHAEGRGTQATGDYAHAEGYGGTFTLSGVTYTSKAAGPADHTEGYQCLTSVNQPGNHAEGYQTMSTGGASHSEGSGTLASGGHSHAEGSITVASGGQAHAEGYYTTASGAQSHAEGYYTVASGRQTSASGFYTKASGACSMASGTYNKEDSYANWPEWIANTSYSIGDKVKRTSGQTITGYICKTANSDSSFTANKWINQDGKMNYVEIVGNGSAEASRSNARALDWSGNEYLNGDLFINCQNDSTNGTSVSNELSNLSSLISSLNTNKLNKTVAALLYSQNTIYKVGDICIYEDKLYKCKLDYPNVISPSRPFDITYWDETTISALITSGDKANTAELYTCINEICRGATEYNPANTFTATTGIWYHEKNIPYICILKKEAPYGQTSTSIFSGGIDPQTGENLKYHLPTSTNNAWYVYSIFELIKANKDNLNTAIDNICSGITTYYPVATFNPVQDTWYHETGVPFICVLKPSQQQITCQGNPCYHLPTASDAYWNVYGIAELIKSNKDAIQSINSSIGTITPGTTIQEQLNTKAPINSPTFTNGITVSSGPLTIGNTTITEAQLIKLLSLIDAIEITE